MLGTKEPSCSTKVASILRTGVAISAALSASVWARQRFRQTFKARIFALSSSEISSFSTQSPISSSSSSSTWFSLRVISKISKAPSAQNVLESDRCDRYHQYPFTKISHDDFALLLERVGRKSNQLSQCSYVSNGQHWILVAHISRYCLWGLWFQFNAKVQRGTDLHQLLQHKVRPCFSRMQDNEQQI